MPPINERPFTWKRTDVWREGHWLDLWSVVHLLSGVSTGLGLYFLGFFGMPGVLLALFAFVMYEMWEALMDIEETTENRFMDVVVGLIGFLPTFYIAAPRLTVNGLVAIFFMVFAINVGLSVIGWRASQKATELKRRIQARYASERARIVKQHARLRKKLRRRL